MRRWSSSDWKLHRPVQAAALALIIMVEKVDVEARLHDASKPHDALHVVIFRHVAVDPVEQVKAAVGAQRSDIVRGEVLHLALLLQQKELRQDSDGFEVNGKGPDHLEERVVVLIDHQPEQSARAHQVLDGEAVKLWVPRVLLRRREANVVNDRARAANEEDLEE